MKVKWQNSCLYMHCDSPHLKTPTLVVVAGLVFSLLSGSGGRFGARMLEITDLI